MSIVKRFDSKKRPRFYARVHLGQGRYACGPTRDTEREALIDQGQLLATPKRAPTKTVAGLCDWFEEVYPERPSRRPPYELPRMSTIDRMKNSLKPFRKEFGHLKPDEIGRDDLKAWLAKYGWAAEPVKLMFKEAIDSEFVSASPLQGLRAARSTGRSGIDPLAILTMKEVHALADLALEEYPEFGATIRSLILFLAYTCLRPGEAFALEWSDIDGEWINVRRHLTKFGVDTPKNHRTRTVVLPHAAKKALNEMPRRIDQQRIFSTPLAHSYSVSALGWYWRPMRARFLGKLPAERVAQLDVKRLTPYVLRHAGATYLLEKPPHGLGMEPADVALQLGHEDGGLLVVKTYGHPNRQRALERLRRAYNPASVADLRPVKEEAQ